MVARISSSSGRCSAGTHARYSSTLVGFCMLLGLARARPGELGRRQRAGRGLALDPDRPEPVAAPAAAVQPVAQRAALQVLHAPVQRSRWGGHACARTGSLDEEREVLQWLLSISAPAAWRRRGRLLAHVRRRPWLDNYCRADATARLQSADGPLL